MKKKAHELFSGAFRRGIRRYRLTDRAGPTCKGTTQVSEFDGETGDYSSVWTVERVWENRTSLITDPADGRMPTVTPEGQKRRAAAAAARRRQPGPRGSSLAGTLYHVRLAATHRGLPELLPDCADAQRGDLQTEMIHDVRVIPLDGRPASSVHGPVLAWGFARPLGRRYAGGRYDQLQTRELPVHVE